MIIPFMKCIEKRTLTASVVFCFSILILIATSSHSYGQSLNDEDITSPCANCTPPPPCQECKPGEQVSSVYLADGSLVWDEIDIGFPVDTSVGLSRKYNSYDRRAGLFGRGWITAQEMNIAITSRAVTQANADNSPKAADEYESVLIWTDATGRRYFLEETSTGFSPPDVFYFTFEKQADGSFKQVFADSQDYHIYSSTGKILEHYSDDNGTSVYYDYNGEGELTRQYDSYGYELEFSYNDQGFVRQVTDNLDRVWQYGYDPDDGRLIEVTDPEDNTRYYDYDLIDKIGYKQHVLTYINDNGNDPVLLATWSNVELNDYSQMRVIAYTGIDGQLHTYVYSDNTYGGNAVTKVVKEIMQVNTSSVIEQQTFHVDRDNYNILKVRNNTTSLLEKKKYDDHANLIELTDKRDNVTQYEYNSQGRQTKITELVGTPDEKVITIDYWNNTDRIATMNEYGVLETSNTYDADLRLLTRIETDISSGDQREWKYTYYPNTVDSEGNDVLGELESIDGVQIGTQDTTLYNYNSRGQLTQTNHPENLVEQFVSDSAGYLIEKTEKTGTISRMKYNSTGQIVEVERNGNIIQYEYNAQDQLITSIDALDKITRYTYTTENQIQQIVYPTGDYLEFDYQYDGSYTQVTRDSYNVDNELLSQQVKRIDPRTGLVIASYLHNTSEQVSGHSYNILDELIETTLYGSFAGGASAQHSYSYDNQGRMILEEDPDGVTTEYEYDVFGRLVAVTDGNLARTQYSLDAWGNQIEVDSPDAGNTPIQYNNNDQQANIVDSSGRTTDYTYDALNRPVNIDFAGTRFDIYLIYDQNSFGNGKLYSARLGLRTNRYTYNQDGLLAEVLERQSGRDFDISYSYDQNFRLTQVTYPSGLQLTKELNSLGKTTKLTVDQGAVATEVVKSIVRENDQIVSITYGNDMVTIFDYDASGRLLGKTYDADNQFSNVLDNQGNIIEQTWVRDGQLDVNTFEYDNLSRIIKDTSPTDNIAWLFDYDPVGNRLESNKADASITVNYQYEANSNRLDQLDAQATSLDDTGNTLNDTKRLYSYRNSNLMTRMEDINTGQETRYSYNSQNQRMSKRLPNNSITLFVYGQQGELIGEYDNTGNRVREYIYSDQEGIDLVAFVDANGDIFYVHTDHLATPRMVSDASQTIVWRWISDAFGMGAAIEDPDNDSTDVVLNHRFPGQYYDQESGLHYSLGGYYDPEHGRYLSSDPIGVEGGLNTFEYASSKPLSFYDERGLKK